MDVKVGSSLRDCRLRTDLGELPRILGESLLQESSRFRIYRYKDEDRETIEWLLSPGDLTDPALNGEFGAWYRETSGTRVSWGDVYGQTMGNTGFAFRCAYVPDRHQWDLRVISNRPVTVAIRKLDPGHPSTPIEWEDWWREWNLIARLDIWDLVDYWEVLLSGPRWNKGELAIVHSLAEHYMQDLLAKTLEMSSRFLPSFTEVGATYEIRNAQNVFAVERRIPRISWATIFGPRYVEKYGHDFLLGAPGYRKEELPDGSILYQVTEHFFVTDDEVERAPSPEEVEGYFRQHPEVRKIVYRPLLLRNFIVTPRGERRQKGAKTSTDLSNDAEQVVHVFGDRFGIALDYSPESLGKVDEAISKFFEEGDEPLPTTVLPIGAYVGEVVRVNLGGQWHITEPLLDSAIDLAGVELYPFRRVAKRFEEGSSASLRAWYEAAARAMDRRGTEGSTRQPRDYSQARS